MSARPQASLQGDLARFAPEIVLQILALVRADGVLVLQSAGARGEVFLRGGKIVAAQLGSGRGQRRRAATTPGAGRGRGRSRSAVAPPEPPALPEPVRDTVARVLAWRQGGFSFRHGATAEVEGAPLEVEGLLLECMTQMDRVRGGVAGEQGR
ncbi:MAG TPA: DUF4388 domain-containing protein [Candidatus Krumholzibacteria bacterium]|nr:DUF4388 domain-containing protein [Candidatus Krumholzibacteria bacterium]